MKLSNLHIGLLIGALILIILLRNKLKLAAASVAPGTGVGTNNVSYLGDSSLPRGIRNNNPGNLKMTTPRQGWSGAVDNPTDGTFEQFYFYVYGLRAMAKLIYNKIKGGYNTPRKLITNWAPASDNNPTSAYVSAVAGVLAIGEDTVMNLDKETIRRLAEVIEEFENGMSVMTDDDFNRAWALI